MRYFLGIDPGATGALAFFDPIADDMVIYDMPTHTVKVSGKEKRKLDFTGLASILDKHAADTAFAIIEEVNAMPKQGITSTFSFGRAFGAAEMVVAANFISYTTERPDSWKRAMRLTRDKDGARREASRLMPKHAGLWPLVKHDGRAEAALLAYHLVRCRNN